MRSGKQPGPVTDAVPRPDPGSAMKKRRAGERRTADTPLTPSAG
jgi:hypothetical protein